MRKQQPIQNGNVVEAANPGFTAVAGPYGVNMTDKAGRISERAACVRAYRDQHRACPHAKIILHGKKAWIIRKLPLELDNGKRHKLVVSGDLGIATWRPVKR